MAYQTKEDSKPIFNPFREAKFMRCKDLIRPEHQHPNIEGKLWEGAVLCSAAGKVYFWYGEHRYFDELSPKLLERGTKVIQSFQGITIDSFLRAKEEYRRTGSIEVIDHFLAYQPRPDL